MSIIDFLLSFGIAGAGDGGAGGGDGGASGTQPPVGGQPDPSLSQNLPVIPQWAANLPTELTADESSRNFLGRFKGDGDKVEVPTELIKSAIESQKMIGGMVKIPTENAPAEDVNAFNKKLGVPDNPNAYEFKTPDNSPEGLFSPAGIDAFRKDAHELGLPKKKAEELFSRFAGRQVTEYAAIMADNQKTLQERVDGLKSEFGTEYDATIKVADKAVHFADPAMIDVFEKAGLLGHPALVKGFAKIGKALGEGTLKGVDTSGTPPVKVTKEEVEGWMRDPKYKLPEGDPVGKAWRAKVEAGFKQLYPGTGPDIGPSSGHSLHGA